MSSLRNRATCRGGRRQGVCGQADQPVEVGRSEKARELRPSGAPWTALKVSGRRAPWHRPKGEGKRRGVGGCPRHALQDRTRLISWSTAGKLELTAHDRRGPLGAYLGARRALLTRPVGFRRARDDPRASPTRWVRAGDHEWWRKRTAPLP